MSKLLEACKELIRIDPDEWGHFSPSGLENAVLNSDDPEEMERTVYEFLETAEEDVKTRKAEYESKLQWLLSIEVPHDVEKYVFKQRITHGKDRVCPLSGDVDCYCHIKQFGFHDYKEPDSATILKQRKRLAKINGLELKDIDECQFQPKNIDDYPDVAKFGAGPILMREVRDAKSFERLRTVLDDFGVEGVDFENYEGDYSEIRDIVSDFINKVIR